MMMNVDIFIEYQEFYYYFDVNITLFTEFIIRIQFFRSLILIHTSTKNYLLDCQTVACCYNFFINVHFNHIDYYYLAGITSASAVDLESFVVISYLAF